MRGGMPRVALFVVMPALAVTALVGAGLLAPAAANSRTFHDAAGDTATAQSDLTRVLVRNGGPSGTRVYSSAQVGDLAPGDRTTFWIDTKASNPGPEYKALVLPNSDGFHLEKVNSWDGPSPGVQCRGLRARADAAGPDKVSISVPRRCMDRPARVRLSLHVKYSYATRNVVDWGPGKHRWFGWVRK